MSPACWGFKSPPVHFNMLCRDSQKQPKKHLSKAQTYSSSADMSHKAKTLYVQSETSLNSHQPCEKTSISTESTQNKHKTLSASSPTLYSIFL